MGILHASNKRGAKLSSTAKISKACSGCASGLIEGSLEVKLPDAVAACSSGERTVVRAAREEKESEERRSRYIKVIKWRVRRRLAR